jgi:hypothetical protein
MKHIFLRIIFKVLNVGISACAGISSAIIVISPFIWIAYSTADDGPFFPPPLVALGLFGLPYAVLLFPLQLIVAVYEFFSQKILGILLLPIAVGGGLMSGFLWHLVERSSKDETLLYLILLGTALMQSLVVFGFTWLINRFVPVVFKFFLKKLSDILQSYLEKSF